MRSVLPVSGLLSGALLIVAGCTPAAPATPTNPPAAPATTAPSPSAALKPASSPVPSPSPAVAASPAPSPSAAASGSASPQPPVNAPLLFSGTPTPSFALQSSAFSNNGNLPKDFSCDGPNGGSSPPISWTGAPSTTRALALVDQDADANLGGGALVTHWVVYNIPSSVTQLEQAQPTQPTLSNGALQGLNVRRNIGYLPACPPAGAAPHHYTFQLYALDGTLPLQPGASILDLQNALKGHIVGQTELIALFGH